MGVEQMKFIEKIIVSVVSTLIFSILLAAVEEISVNSLGYFSVELIFVYCIYSFPIYLIGGGVYSYFVDIYFYKIPIRNWLFKYIIGFLLYVVGGLLVIGIILMMLLIVEGKLDDILITKTFVIGTLASLLFFHVSLILKQVLKFAAR